MSRASRKLLGQAVLVVAVIVAVVALALFLRWIVPVVGRPDAAPGATVEALAHSAGETRLPHAAR